MSIFGYFFTFVPNHWVTTAEYAVAIFKARLASFLNTAIQQEPVQRIGNVIVVYTNPDFSDIVHTMERDKVFAELGASFKVNYLYPCNNPQHVAGPASSTEEQEEAIRYFSETHYVGDCPYVDIKKGELPPPPKLRRVPDDDLIECPPPPPLQRSGNFESWVPEHPLDDFVGQFVPLDEEFGYTLPDGTHPIPHDEVF